MSAPLAVATRYTRAMIPWWWPSNQRIWIVKLPSSPTYATARIVPAILAMVRPGFSNWRLCTTKRDHEHGDEAQERPGQHVQRPRRVVAQGRAAIERIVPGQPTCGSQLATSNASTPPITEFADGRALVASSSPTSSRAADDEREAGQQEPERIPGRQPFIDAEREQEPGYHRQADEKTGREHSSRARPGVGALFDR